MVQVWKRTTGFAIGHVTDSHIGQTGPDSETNFQTCLEWLFGRTPKPLGIIHSGDLTQGSEGDWKAWYDEFADTGIVFLPTVGNHDTTVAWGDYSPIDGNPFAPIKNAYPSRFRGSEYYYWNPAGYSLRVMMVNNISDYLGDGGNSCYHNCNPPGDQLVVNPDFSGCTSEGSAQNVWLRNKSASPHLWKIVSGHRAWIAPFDSDPRKMNKVARPMLYDPIQNGVSLVLQGDIHLGSLSGPWTVPDWPDVANEVVKVNDGAVGAYSYTGAGGYVVRAVDVSKIPGYIGGTVTDISNNPNVHWAKGGSGSSGIVHALYIQFFGDIAELTVFESSDAVPAGAVVHQQTIKRNPGV